MLHYLPLPDAEHVDRPHLYPLAGRGYALELSPVRTAHRHSGGYPVPFRHHVLDDDAEIREALAGLREGLLEGLDELGGRVAWEEFIVGRVLIHDLARPPEVSRRDDLVDPPGDGLVLFGHAGPPSPVPSVLPGITTHLAQGCVRPTTPATSLAWGNPSIPPASRTRGSPAATPRAPRRGI